MKTIPDNCDERPLYEDETEQRLHRTSMEILSLHIGESVDSVRRLYEIVLRRFKEEATVKDFLPILVKRKVSDLIDRKRQHTVRIRKE